MHSRFKALKNYGEEDLKSLKEQRVAVIGLGATGSVIAESLARHGINLVLIDRDYLEMNDCYSSNIYTPEDCKESIPKAKAAEEVLTKFTEVNSFCASLDSSKKNLLNDCDLIMDGADNIRTRRFIDKFSQKKNVPWIYSAALGERGYSMIFDSKCFHCMFEKVKPGTLETCESEGIMREVSGMVGLRSAHKAVKYLCDREYEEKLDILPEGDKYKIEKKGCSVCEGKIEFSDGRFTTAVCGENKYEIKAEISEKAFQRIKQRCKEFEENDYLIRAKFGTGEIVLFKSGRAIVEGKDMGHAKEIFAEKVGV